VCLRILGRKRDEVKEEWKELNNEELKDLYFSSNIVRVIKSKRTRYAVHVARMGERISVYRVVVRKSDVKRPFGRPRLRREDNIEMDLHEVGCGGAWTGLIWLRIGPGGGLL